MGATLPVLRRVLQELRVLSPDLFLMFFSPADRSLSCTGEFSKGESGTQNLHTLLHLFPAMIVQILSLLCMLSKYYSSNFLLKWGIRDPNLSMIFLDFVE